MLSFTRPKVGTRSLPFKLTDMKNPDGGEQMHAECAATSERQVKQKISQLKPSITRHALSVFFSSDMHWSEIRYRCPELVPLQELRTRDADLNPPNGQSISEQPLHVKPVPEIRDGLEIPYHSTKKLSSLTLTSS